jgi:copper chaperone
MQTFEIPNMSCNHCVRAITEAVHSVDAQARVDTALAEHRVQVDSQAPREQLVEALKEAGYAPA